MTANGTQGTDRLVFSIVLGLVNGIVMAIGPLIGTDFANSLVHGGFSGAVATLSALVLGPIVKGWIDRRKIQKGQPQ